MQTLAFSAAFSGAAELYIEGGKMNFYLAQILNEINVM